MSDHSANLERLLVLAREREKEYDWPGAAEAYQRAIESVPNGDPRTIGDTLERRAYALYKKALQAENVDEFNRSADVAGEAYAVAVSANRKADMPEGRARASRCEATAAFLRYLRGTETEERKRHAEDAWNHAKDALAAFGSISSPLEFCRTFVELFPSAFICSCFVLDYETRKKIWMEATSFAEKGLRFCPDLADRDTAIQTMVITSSLLERGTWSGLIEEDVDEGHARAVDLWSQAKKMDESAAIAALPLTWFAGQIPLDPLIDVDKVISACKEALNMARSSKDRLAIGLTLAALSQWTFWLSRVRIEKDEIDGLAAESLKYAIQGGDEFLKIGYLAEAGHAIWTMSPHVDYHILCALNEKDLQKKRELAEKALAGLPEYVSLARKAGYSFNLYSAMFDEALILHELAKTETDTKKKRELLEKAAERIDATTVLIERCDAGDSYNLSVYHGTSADIHNALAEVTDDHKMKVVALRETIDLRKKCIGELVKGMREAHFTQDRASNVFLGEMEGSLARLHCTLHEYEHNQDHLGEAIELFEKSAESYLRADMPSRAAESLWEAAKVYDQSDKPAMAAERFLSAAKEFRAGGEKVPRLKELYSDQAMYLEGWARFEEAKHHRASQEYHQSRQCFEMAADLHDKLPGWRFLAPNSRAWAQIDKGEALSREDRRQEASEAFEEAAALFEESTSALNDANQRAKNADEKRMISGLMRAAGPRREYCLARSTIEKARQMDVEGKSSSSSEMYRTAAEQLERLAGRAISEQDRNEIMLRAVICRAWQKMNRAEADVSPEPYAEAAILFEQVRELSANQKAKALALGHSRFCKALEAGTKFADTREPTLHAAAVKSLESASAYYVKAGADTCSEYARASKLLFDAYAYLAEASQEKDQEKAAKTYSKAERVLKACSQSYDKAGQPGKKNQVIKLIERVRQDKELAVSLMDVLEAPTGESSTAAFGSLPTPIHEEAAGLDRFAHADVQAMLIVKRKDLKVGEDMGIEIELVNAGRASAVLTKVENIIPSGFEVLSKPANYRIEDSYIMMKGKRLDPFKTEEIALVLKPTAKGEFQLRPRILYLDDEGLYKARDVEGCNITVRELGVAGWLRGPERKE